MEISVTRKNKNPINRHTQKHVGIYSKVKQLINIFKRREESMTLGRISNFAHLRHVRTDLMAQKVLLATNKQKFFVRIVSRISCAQFATSKQFRTVLRVRVIKDDPRINYAV